MGNMKFNNWAANANSGEPKMPPGTTSLSGDDAKRFAEQLLSKIAGGNVSEVMVQEVYNGGKPTPKKRRRPERREESGKWNYIFAALNTLILATLGLILWRVW